MNAFEASPLIPHGFVSCVVLSLEAAANSCCFYLSIAPGFGHSGSEVQGDNFIFEVLKHGLINLYSTVDGSSRAPCDGFVFRSAFRGASSLAMTLFNCFQWIVGGGLRGDPLRFHRAENIFRFWDDVKNSHCLKAPDAQDGVSS